MFGLFTSLAVKPAALPGPLRPQLPPDVTLSAAAVRLDALPASYISSLWQYWNTAILPAHTAGKLGLVIFQFQLSFSPSDAHRQHVEWCRRHLCSAYRMGVEFRDRRWLRGDERSVTLAWLTSLDITYIVCDDLEQETYRPNRDTIGEDSRIPIIHATTATHSLYIRLHRRTGDNRGDRVLAASEFTDWADRLAAEQSVADVERRRAVFFLWGTDCVDDPITNARKMSEVVKERAAALWLDWRGMRKEGMKQAGGGSIIGLFAKQEKRNREQRVQDDERPSDTSVGHGGGGTSKGGEKIDTAGLVKAEQFTTAAAVTANDNGNDGINSVISEHKESAASRKRQRLEIEHKNDEAVVAEG